MFRSDRLGRRAGAAGAAMLGIALPLFFSDARADSIAVSPAAGIYSGSVYQTTGPRFDSPFVPGGVRVVPVGRGTLTFDGADAGLFSYASIPLPGFTLPPGIAGVRAIGRQTSRPLPACTFGALADLAQATNYTDLWRASPPGSESGWGSSLAHQGDTIFAAWFTYGVDSLGMWLVANATTAGPARYAGTLYRTTGPDFLVRRFDADKVVATPVGAMTIDFADGNRAMFSYTVATGGGSVTQSKSITRQVFAAPGTACR
jgi:hypothetical protein